MKKYSIAGFVGILVFLMCSLTPVQKAQAASDFNLLTAVNKKTVRSGTWQKSAKGLRYVYDNGKYPKKVWRKIGGHYYYFDSKGYVKTGWVKFKGNRYFLSRRSARRGQLLLGSQKINGKIYFFSRKTGAMLCGWQKINKKWYHFDEITGVMSVNTWVGNRYLKNNGVMATSCWVDGKYVRADGTMAVNCWIDGKYLKEDGTVALNCWADGKYIQADGTIAANCWIDGKYVQADGSVLVNCWIDGRYVGSDGYVVTTSTEQAVTGKLIFVGDSRTVGLYNTVGGDAVYIGKAGEGYSWFVKTGINTLKLQLEQFPESQVVLNFGINDPDNVYKYCECYRKLMEQYPKAEFYIMSVNPMEDGKGSWYVTDEHIRKFNEIMKETFPENYLDCYSELTRTGFKTVDGVHYTLDTYRKIYSFAVSSIQK